MITNRRSAHFAKVQVRCAILTATAITVATAVGHVYGSAVAFDSAADPAYNLQPGEASGWLQLSNGGYGFGPWLPRSGNPNPTNPIGVIGSSTTNGNGDPEGDGDINTPRNASGRAWGLMASPATDQNPDGGASGATRMLSGPLSVGQAFRIDMDNGNIADPSLSDGTRRPGAVGWALQGSDPALDQFLLEAEANSPDYLFARPFGTDDTGIPLTDQGVHCEFTLLGPSKISPFPLQWMLTITTLGPGGTTKVLTGTRMGTPIDRLTVGDAGGGTDPADAVYFNSISVGDVPEPGAVGVVGLGAMLVLRRRRG